MQVAAIAVTLLFLAAIALAYSTYRVLLIPVVALYGPAVIVAGAVAVLATTILPMLGVVGACTAAFLFAVTYWKMFLVRRQLYVDPVNLFEDVRRLNANRRRAPRLNT